MKTIDEIKGRCRIDEFTGCWNWAGAMGQGKYPRIWQTEGGEERSMPGRRAAWLALGRELPSGWRVYGTCESLTCVNPAHIKAGPVEEFWSHTRETGSQRGNIKRITANRLIGRKRAALPPETVAQVRVSRESGLALAEKHGVAPASISKYRRQGLRCYESVGGMFTQLTG